MFKRFRLKKAKKRHLSIADEIQVIKQKVVAMNEKDEREEHKLTIQHLNGAYDWQIQLANRLQYEHDEQKKATRRQP